MRKRFVFLDVVVGIASALGLLLLMTCTAQKPQSIFEVVKTGTPERVKSFLDKGGSAQVNEIDSSFGEPVLTWAAQFNPNPEVTAILLKAGAVISAKDLYKSHTALMWAAQDTKSAEVITALVKAGANVNETDDEGLTPLLIAAANNDNPEVISRLVAEGADLKAKDQNGYTVLMEAASKSHNPQVIVALLKAGADAKAKNAKGYAAIDYARANQYLKNSDAAKQLESASQ
jgi:ankyrin repeat protein